MRTLFFILTAAMVGAATGCASWNYTPSSLGIPTLSGSTSQPGTPDWWKANKSKREFVLGKGWQVPGAAGYFDDQGRPIGTKVAKEVKVAEVTTKKGLLDDVEVVKSVSKMKSQFGMGPDQKVAQASYTEGESLFRAQKYGDATKKFDEAYSRWPKSALAQDALFYKAESEFFDKQYPEAVNTYTQLLEDFPNTPHLDKVVRRQFDIARYWEQHHQYDPEWATTPNMLDETRPLFDTLGRALKTYENIRLNDPTGPLADDSIMATANSYFLRGRYSDADYQYELLRNEYPRSEHQFEAHILGLQCKLRKYQGTDYVDTPLQEAKKLVKQLKIQFAGELSDEERERLGTVEAQLNQQLAQRDYNMAQYYDELKNYGSAKFYYALLIRDYPETPLATKARERYLALGGKPDHPESKIGWLVGLFPESAERQSIAQVPLLGPAETQPAVQIATQPSTTDGVTLQR